METVLALKIDPAEDKESGFPSVVCRKCCNLVETFFHFQVKAYLQSLQISI